MASQLEYNNIFEAITSDEGQAAEMAFRAEMIIAMRGYFEDRGWNQAQIGKRLGISQPRVSELATGKLHLLSADRLIRYLSKIGFYIRPAFKTAGRGKTASISCKIEDCAA
jgi:predicted XRE-type DNA-binding protein